MNEWISEWKIEILQLFIIINVIINNDIIIPIKLIKNELQKFQIICGYSA